MLPHVGWVCNKFNKKTFYRCLHEHREIPQNKHQSKEDYILAHNDGFNNDK